MITRVRYFGRVIRLTERFILPLQLGQGLDMLYKFFTISGAKKAWRQSSTVTVLYSKGVDRSSLFRPHCFKKDQVELEFLRLAWSNFCKLTLANFFLFAALATLTIGTVRISKGIDVAPVSHEQLTQL